MYMLFKNKRLYVMPAAALLLSTAAWAEGPQPPASFWHPFALVMMGVIVVLLIVIKSLAGVLLNAARQSRDLEKMEKQVVGAGPDPRPATNGPSGILTATIAAPVINGLSDTAFYLIVSVVAIEILVILYLLYNLNILLKAEKAKELAEVRVRSSFSFRKWWTKINRFRPAEQEADMDMGHDYDGIRELDNKLPPWWLYGFYGTILFGCIYIWRYHISHTAPLPAQEYQIAVHDAELAKADYLKKAANAVDENTVKLLTAPADLAAGKAIFQTTCFACHGKSGEGGVGPNLTDPYWLHGGSIQQVFKTIKYGWPDKGMKSWKDDYSPSQIAQIACYVKSLGGTNPANAKAPQGDIDK
jgi:cytochrome c oxidase cbb3-type subunit 3